MQKFSRKSYPVDKVTQFKILAMRSFKEIVRDKVLTRLRAGAHVAAAIVIGLLYLQRGPTNDDVQSQAGYIFFSYVHVAS